MTTIRTAIHLTYLTQLRATHQRLKQAFRDVQQTQQQKLLSILQHNQNTEFGRAHRFSKHHTVEDFQRHVPLTTYDEMSPWFEQIAAGQHNVLTQDPVLMMERTGGSTARNKLIPYTKGLLAEFEAATNAWIYDIYINRPLLWGTQSYWSVSPATRGDTHTHGGVPIGFEDDTEYFGPVARWALKQLMAVDGDVARLPDMDTWRRETAIQLLNAPDLGFVSVWHPTFWSLLLDYIHDNRDALIPQLAPHRRHVLDQHPTTHLDVHRIWPRLSLISCWADAAARHAANTHIRQHMPDVELQPKGVLATEGVITIPWSAQNTHVLAVNSHFYEFIDTDNPDAPPRCAWALERDHRYGVVLTTSGGLYRYQLHDEVLCTGHIQGAPCLRLVGKLDKTSDLCGEKLNAKQVTLGLELASAQLDIQWSFALLAPTMTPTAHYTLFIDSTADETTLQRLTTLLDDHLRGGHHYDYCRDLGQLAPITLQRVRHGQRRYIDALTQRGQRAGDIKPSTLDSRTFWPDVFAP